MKQCIHCFCVLSLLLMSGCRIQTPNRKMPTVPKGNPHCRFGPYPHIDRSRIYGMGYPALLRLQYGDFSLEQAIEGIDLMHGMGVRSWRAWMHTRLLLKDPTTPNMKYVEPCKKLIQIAQHYDIEVIGMNHDWFNPSVDTTVTDADGTSIHARDLTPDSEYMRTLQQYETSWKTLASLFPEITLWEVGNEWNHDPFLHPLDYRKTGMRSIFTWKEKAAIVTDLLYYASRRQP